MQNSIGLIREAFLEHLEEDYFQHLYARGELPSSIRSFIEVIASGNATASQFPVQGAAFPDLSDLSMTFGQFQRLPFFFEDGRNKIATMLDQDFCLSTVAPLAWKIAIERDDDPACDEAFAEVGVDSWEAWGSAMAEPSRVDTVAAALSETMSLTLANRTLLSFFDRAPKIGQFSLMKPEAYSDFGHTLPTHVTTNDEYSVEIRVCRYDEVECAVTAYEWIAKLTMAGAVEHDAAACGMVYVFDRVKGKPSGDFDDLILAADSMADDDVLQVQSFLDQHADATQVVEKSDLAFVWLWERREGAANGLGAKCLRAAVSDLKRRFKKVRTVILDARPAQFADWTSENEPTLVKVAKIEALDSLVSYIQSLSLDADVRPIFNSFDYPHGDALEILGKTVCSIRERA